MPTQDVATEPSDSVPAQGHCATQIMGSGSGTLTRHTHTHTHTQRHTHTHTQIHTHTRTHTHTHTHTHTTPHTHTQQHTHTHTHTSSVHSRLWFWSCHSIPGCFPTLFLGRGRCVEMRATPS